MVTHHLLMLNVYKKSSAKDKFFVERTQDLLHLEEEEEEAEVCCWERKKEEEVRVRLIHGCCKYSTHFQK